jgi:GLPGLI family protein
MKLGDSIQKINMALDINKNDVKFYDYIFIKYDSLSKKTGDQWHTNTVSDQLISRKINTFENKSFHDNFDEYFVMTSYDEMTWKLEPDTKNVENYHLQKATTNFGGRNWTAWFCPDILFQEGPYKFRGLPGLIFELKDDGNNFVYSLTKSFNLPETFDTSGFLESHYGKNPIPVILKQYYKIKLDFYNDPFAKIRTNLAETLKTGTVQVNGEEITSVDQLDQKREFVRKMLKKYYNPVELDKAIPYPD